MQCLEALDELVAKQAVTYDNLIYLYLNKAPCADYNGNRKNCLDKVIKWAKTNPSRKLVLAFKKPYAIGSFTERGSWHRPDKVVRLETTLIVIPLDFRTSGLSTG